jgi:hypothetical protein
MKKNNIIYNLINNKNMKEYVIKYDVISTTNGSSIVMSENIKSSKIGNELKKEVSDFLDNKM